MVFGPDNQIAVLAAVAFENGKNAAGEVIGNEIADFRLIGAYPEAETKVFLVLVLERIAAYRAGPLILRLTYYWSAGTLLTYMKFLGEISSHNVYRLTTKRT